jgi:hypothetical protein
LDGTFIEQIIDSTTDPKKKKKEEKKINQNDKRAGKFRHAVSYIKYISTMFSDTSPTKSNIYALPYETRHQVYEEYRHFCKTTLKLNYNKFAGRETFRLAFDSLKDTIKLVGSKGNNFNSICYKQFIYLFLLKRNFSNM